MLPHIRGYLRNEDDAYRTRKKIHETGINEAFEIENSFFEFENSSTLYFWHKFKLSDLIPTLPPSYQLVEGDTTPSEEDEQDINDLFEQFTVSTSVRVTDDVTLQVSYAAGPIRSQIKRNFALKLEFKLIYKSQEVIQALFNRKIGIVSKMFLKLDGDFSSKRKVTITINESSANSIICNSEISYQNDEELLHELQIDLSSILIEEDEDGTPNGLVNLGVTCYMNSYLQTIFHLKKFRYFINRLENEDNANSFVFSLQSLFYKLEKMRNNSPSPQQLVSSFGWNIQQIFTQQDVQEFSFMLLDAIEKKCQKFGMSELINKELFQGISESFIKCKDIEYESKREEVFADVQLAIKGSKNLQEAIENYLAIEELVGDNAYDTEKFGKRDAIKGVRFKKLPKVLIFHLSRFEYDYRFDENVKVLTEFVYPENIDMDLYVGERTIEKMRRKSSMMTELNEMSQSGMKNGISMTNSNGHGNGHLYMEQDSKDQCEAISLEQVQNSENGYTLFGVFVHFGQNAYSGHYEVYLKIEDSWYEFNDDVVRKTDFEEVKRQSFGGKRKVHIFDTRSFKLRERMRDTDGHAYMLVYIRAKDYEEIVRNNGQIIPYPQNVTEFANGELFQLEKEHLKRTYHKIYLFQKETFLNQQTGRGIFFHVTCNHDHLKYKRFKQNGNFSQFLVKQSATTAEIVAKIKTEIQPALDDEIFLFFYNERRDEFSSLDTNEMFPSFNSDHAQYIYVHIVKKLPEDREDQYVPAFTVLKKWNPETKIFSISHIKLLTSRDTMVGMEDYIKQLENGQEVYVFYEDLKERRLDPIEEPRSIKPLYDLLQMRHQSSINFAYCVISPEKDEDNLKSEMAFTFRSFMTTYELTLRDRSTHELYYLPCKTDIMTSEVFQHIRKLRNIEEDSSVTIELNVWKNNQLITVPECRRDIALFSLTKVVEMTFEIKQAIIQLDDDPAAKNLSIWYHGYRGVTLNISEHFNFEKYNGTDPTREQIIQDLKGMPQLEVEMAKDLQQLLDGDTPIRLVDFALYEKTDREVRLMTHSRTYNNCAYFVVPALEIELPSETDSAATLDNEDEIEDEIPSKMRIELRINSKTGRLLLLPMLFVVPTTLKANGLLKLIECIVCKLRIQNPENSDFLEAEYIRRNLKIYANVDGREHDLEKLNESRLHEFDTNFAELTAVISMDSFRNNIKINI